MALRLNSHMRSTVLSALLLILGWSPFSGWSAYLWNPWTMLGYLSYLVVRFSCPITQYLGGDIPYRFVLSTVDHIRCPCTRGFSAIFQILCDLCTSWHIIVFKVLCVCLCACDYVCHSQQSILFSLRMAGTSGETGCNTIRYTFPSDI